MPLPILLSSRQYYCQHVNITVITSILLSSRQYYCHYVNITVITSLRLQHHHHILQAYLLFVQCYPILLQQTLKLSNKSKKYKELTL